MFLLGLASILQITFLPGYCLMRIFALGGLAATVPLAFGLSQIANYFLVQALRSLELYRRDVLLAIFTLELLFAIACLWPRLKAPVGSLLREAKQTLGALIEIANGERGKARVFAIGGLITSALAFVFFGFFGIREIGQVFRTNDAINSWNEWAREWFIGGFEAPRTFYPHLLPINWSITYKFIATPDIEIFAKATMPLYALMTIVAAVSHALRRRDAGWLIAASVIGVLIPITFSWHFLYGYADIPTMFFGFIGLLVITDLDRAPSTTNRRKILLVSTLFLGSAALCKQSGLVFAGFAVVLVAVLRDQGAIRLRVASILALTCLVVPTYVNRAIDVSAQIRLDPDPVVLHYAVGLGSEMGVDYYYRTSWSERIEAGVKHIIYPGTLTRLRAVTPAPILVDGLHLAYWAGLALLAVLVGLSATAYPLGTLATTFGLVHLCAWSLQWGYDVRNLSPSVAFLAVASSIGFRQIASLSRFHSA